MISEKEHRSHQRGHYVFTEHGVAILFAILFCIVVCPACSSGVLGWAVRSFVGPMMFPVSAALKRQSPVDEEPVFSPDGSKIYFTSYRGGRWGSIRVYDLQSKTTTNLFDSREDRFARLIQHPALSPDGRLIAFTESQRNIFAFAANDTRAVLAKYCDDEKSLLNSLTWSNDGQFIFFSQDSSVYKIRLSQPESPTLVYNAESLLGDSQGGIFNLHFSPDNRFLLFTVSLLRSWLADDVGGIYELNMISGAARRLESTNGRDYDAIYSRDGKRILFSSETSIVSVQRDGSSRKTIYSSPFLSQPYGVVESLNGTLAFVDGPRMDRGIILLKSDSSQIRISPHKKDLHKE